MIFVYVEYLRIIQICKQFQIIQIRCRIHDATSNPNRVFTLKKGQKSVKSVPNRIVQFELRTRIDVKYGGCPSRRNRTPSKEHRRRQFVTFLTRHPFPKSGKKYERHVAPLQLVLCYEYNRALCHFDTLLRAFVQV